MEFRDFQSAVLTQFDLMKGHQLFVTSVDKDALWEKYLASFPEGTNPMFRERTEHDCNCCKQFIRSVGRVVAIIDGKKVSIWDCMVNDPTYQIVANAMAEMVKAAPIENVLLHDRNVPTGTAKTVDKANFQTWNHFHITLPSRYLVAKDTIGTKLGDSLTTHDMLVRALTTIDNASISAVLELMAQGSLYRGDEKKSLVNDFLKVKKAFDKLTTDEARDLFCWQQSTTISVGVSRIRNDVVGTLLVDLAEGKDLEASVKAWESKMAPANYKRPTALITQAMIDKARKEIEELGLTSALQRRKATRHDLNVNDILHTNGISRQIMTGNDGIFGELVATKVAEQNFNKIEEIGIEKFISDVLPNINSMEAFFENHHAPNLVSLIAPSDPESKSMFKWPSRFSWSYKDAMADALKERVKAAGGAVEGDLCCRLGWYNHDDLDFHMVEPGNYEIEYTNKGRISPSGGMLDVDMNAGYGTTRTPVENIFYTDKRKMREGVYILKVHNFCKRESNNVGFEVQIDMGGVIHNIAYTQAVPGNKTITVAKIKYSAKNGFEIIESLPSSQTSKQIWGLVSQSFHPVNIMMLSPNHWDGSSVGNKHYMFFLDKCVNDDANIRGFFNENLIPELEKHRKTMEIVGSKLTVADSPDELSGLGFSSTVRNHLVVRVKGAITRTLKLIF